jgi:2-dehydro-3-deoxyphosphooctonate aldolase (KDO 8-P synthase)
MSTSTVELTSSISIGNGLRPVYIAGPCVIESLEQCLGVARRLAEIAAERSLPLLFKASFDKANRSSVESFRGPGLDEGLAILAEIKAETGLPLVTDVHLPEQAGRAAEVVDVLQVPAFLCRQTDLLTACGETGLPVNVKKGQFLAPEDMGNAVAKVRSTGNDRVTLTERGSTFGYHNLVVDFRSFPQLAATGCPVVFDATHSVQLPAAQGKTSGGDRAMIPTLAAAAVAAGADAIFMEVHPDPDRALCDGANSLPLNELAPLLKRLKKLKLAAAS